MEECFACKTNTDEYYIEELYFNKTGRKLCKLCLDAHCASKIDGIHFCCQDFKDTSGNYVHYNMPYFGEK